MSKGLTIHFSVHPTPKQSGEEGQTYHVRQNIRRVIHSQEFREHISDYSLVTPGLFEMVIDYVEKEIAEQLLAGYSVHIDGLGPPFPKYYRTRQGNMWVYRKTGT